MRRAVVALLVPVTFLLTACGALVGGDPGPARTEDRPISAVGEVELAASGALELRTGDTPSLRITAGENVIGDLTSEVSGDRLVLDAHRQVGDLGAVRYELVLPAARLVRLSGSGSVHATAPSALTTLQLPGSGNVQVDGVSGDQLTVDLSGSGRIVVAGEVGRQEVSIDGSGDYSARGLHSRDAQVSIGGSGAADVTVTGTLDATIDGSGTITHHGGATVHSEINGSGTVTAG